jgi:hypothetical protein
MYIGQSEPPSRGSRFPTNSAVLDDSLTSVPVLTHFCAHHSLLLSYLDPSPLQLNSVPFPPTPPPDLPPPDMPPDMPPMMPPPYTPGGGPYDPPPPPPPLGVGTSVGDGNVLYSWLANAGPIPTQLSSWVQGTDPCNATQGVFLMMQPHAEIHQVHKTDASLLPVVCQLRKDVCGTCQKPPLF